MVVGLSFLAKPVWQVFYGASKYGPQVFKFSVFIAFVTVGLSLCTTILLTLKEYKVLFTNLLIGLAINAAMDVPFIYLFNNLGLPPYYGAIAATILGNAVSIIIVITFLYKKYNIDFFKQYKVFLKIILAVLTMILALTGLTYIVPLTAGRITSVFIIALYAVIGALIYFLFTYKTNTIEEVFEKDMVKFIKKKLKKS